MTDREAYEADPAAAEAIQAEGEASQSLPLTPGAKRTIEIGREVLTQFREKVLASGVLFLAKEGD